MSKSDGRLRSAGMRGRRQVRHASAFPAGRQADRDPCARAVPLERPLDCSVHAGRRGKTVEPFPHGHTAAVCSASAVPRLVSVLSLAHGDTAVSSALPERHRVKRARAVRRRARQPARKYQASRVAKSQQEERIQSLWNQIPHNDHAPNKYASTWHIQVSTLIVMRRTNPHGSQL
jgi:hypothetical protein